MKNKQRWVNLGKISILLGTATLGIATQAIAADIPNLDVNLESEDSLSQINNVFQLRDVSPSDWAFEALRNLVEKYGCIAGYPDRTFRGNRAISRYEFAAGLNACMQQMERMIGNNNNSDVISSEDLATLKRLTSDFTNELAMLRGRTDALEARVGELELTQFSTTTKLAGEAIFGIASVLAGDDADGNKIDKVPVFGNRTRIELSTSFTGDDELFTRLSTGNFPEFGEVTGTSEGEIAFAQPDANDLGLEILKYQYPLGDDTQILIAAKGGAADDFANTVNALDGDAGSGAISKFGTRNPIYYQVDDQAGVALIHQFGDKLEVSLGYKTGNASDPSQGNGLFNGAYSGLAQVLFKPSDNFNLGLTYIHSYNQNDTGTGSNLSNFRSFTEDNFVSAVPTSSNSYGVEASWKLSDKFILGGWAGYTKTTTLSSLGGTLDRGSLDIWNWAVTLALPDLGKEGNLGGIIVGMEPKVTKSSINIGGSDIEDQDTSLHIEAFYQYKVNDHVAITPGVIWLTAPDHNSNNDDILIGTIRTTFSF